MSRPEARKPTSVALSRSTLGVRTVSMGYGKCQFRPGGVVATHWPKRRTTPCWSGCTWYKPVANQARNATTTMVVDESLPGAHSLPFPPLDEAMLVGKV